jgi:ubiquitin carboxyl-terminal hydrolase 22/27/51
VEATNGRDSPHFSSLLDAIKTLFEGKLRSVLMCQECGNKRIQSEPFMSISLPLSKEVQKATNEMPGESNEHAGRVKVSVERCLRHFTIPEMLADPVDCPSCGKKTPTQKQHVVSKLPRVLCLHLKRFDAAQNKKIEDFVSFPAKGLNMGPHLPHWYVETTVRKIARSGLPFYLTDRILYFILFSRCEVTRAQAQAPDDSVSEPFTPEILFDLFGTVNHYGNLQSGHYVTNLKVGEKWFHCNDAHVCDAGIGDGEAEVLKSDGAYLLFYIRR